MDAIKIKEELLSSYNDNSSKIFTDEMTVDEICNIFINNPELSSKIQNTAQSIRNKKLNKIIAGVTQQVFIAGLIDAAC